MLERKKKFENNISDKRNLKELTLFNLIECLEMLKKQGFFYKKEYVYDGNGEYIIRVREKELLGLPQKQYEEEKPMGLLCMWFEHVLTREEKCLYIAEELLEDKVKTVLWMEDKESLGSFQRGNGISFKDKPIFFEEILRRCEIILVPGKFYKMNSEEVKKIMNGSLFSLLYEHHYRQVQEGKIDIKEDRHEEKSFAWAGEFLSCSYADCERRYLEIAIYHREYEEWEYGCDGTFAHIWSDKATEVYVALSGEQLAEIRPQGEKGIPLVTLEANEKITNYLDNYQRLDNILTNMI